jgi:hypothetical protein
MPPLGMHMTLARELAQRLGERALTENAGAYYLGATTPDIRVLTRWDRARTHFFDLNDFGEQSGTAGVLRAHPEISCLHELNPETAAFMCGYISHLEMDEAWIVDIYRPCFGERSALKGEALANVLDRVLQHELDRREREDPGVVSEIHDDLLASAVEVAVPFVDNETLLRWRDISADIVSRPSDWERFASRHLRAYGVESDSDRAEFVRNVPDLLDQAIREVTPQRLEQFQERSRERALAALRDYLS